ncbi:MAG: hypothetical protein ABEK10_00725 [Candidatus Nanosalina sp.]
MGLGDKIKQYGNLLVALLITIGFGATFLVYGGGGSNTAPSNTNQQQQRNFTAPSQHYTEQGFNRSFTEQVVIAARDNVVFVNVIYNNESQVSDLRKLRDLQQTYGDKVYIQLVSSVQASDLVTRNGITDYPAVVVQGGVLTRRGPAPQKQVVKNITSMKVEKAICRTLGQLGSAAARCQQIGAI